MNKTATVGFRVEGELAELLDRMPNRSAFIRRAVLAALGRMCPACCGAGVVPVGVVEHVIALIESHRDVMCSQCGQCDEIPLNLAQISPDDQPRWKDFFLGGPYVCAECWSNPSACEA